MTRAKLNQIIAVVQGKKSRAQKLLTEAHRGWHKDAISGISKTYRPKAEDGDQLPPESKAIHLDVPTKIAETMEQLASFYDVVLTQETGNTEARGTVEVNGSAFLVAMPITTLLFMEKQLIDLHTFVANLPTLPADRAWKFDDNRNCYATEPTESTRTQKTPKVVVKYDATKEHPAQTELFVEDVSVGTWTTTYFSSAMPSRNQAQILARIEGLQDAVKSAREAANSIEVDQMKFGRKLLSYVFGMEIFSEQA